MQFVQVAIFKLLIGFILHNPIYTMVQIIPPNPENNRFFIPDSNGNNSEFERFVIQNLFPKQYYSITNQNSGYLSKVENIRQPDFSLRDSATGFEFCIQCKFHYALISNSFRFGIITQVDLNTSSNTCRPVFLVLGLGGTPDSPNEIYFSNFNDCPNEHLLKRHLKGKFIPAGQIIRISDIWKQEVQQIILTKRIA